MDLDAVADELYGLRPDEFVAARDRRALAAREAGDQALAKGIGALRRPSLAAWVGNLLVRRRPEEVRPLLVLGEELRRAHRELDGARLRALARRRNEVIGALGRQAAELAAEAGRPVGEDVRREVTETLHAVLADPDAAREWAAGRLVKPLGSAVGFPAADEALLGRRPTPPPSESAEPARDEDREEGQGPDQGQSRGQERRRRSAGAPETARGTERGSRARRTEGHRGPAEDREKARAAERERQARETGERRRRTAAREQARAAERELRSREAEAEAAGRAAERAGARVTEAEARVHGLRERLREAEEAQRRARAGEREAREGVRQADRAVRDARRRAGTAAGQAERAAGGNAEG
ncbi:hypothetical protein ACF073_10475 [Streptomyces sp. NPDC015171]|uniref:hypothetical protein n=1 Tax=Streptomyces sp. NPDC015171 TaxID=3364945 RepID=UPI0036F7C9BE